MIDIDPICRFLTEERIRQGLSQADVGALAGVSREIVNAWERGRASPNLENVRAWANALHVTLTPAGTLPALTPPENRRHPTMPPTPKRPTESHNSLAARGFDTQVPGRLIVRLDNGDEHYATPADLSLWGFTDRTSTYLAVQRALRAAVTAYGPMADGDELTDAMLNPLRHLVELAVYMPEDLAVLAAKAASNGDQWPDPDTDETAALLANIGVLEQVLTDHKGEVAAKAGRSA